MKLKSHIWLILRQATHCHDLPEISTLNFHSCLSLPTLLFLSLPSVSPSTCSSISVRKAGGVCSNLVSGDKEAAPGPTRKYFKTSCIWLGIHKMLTSLPRNAVKLHIKQRSEITDVVFFPTNGKMCSSSLICTESKECYTSRGKGVVKILGFMEENRAKTCG